MNFPLPKSYYSAAFTECYSNRNYQQHKTGKKID